MLEVPLDYNNKSVGTVNLAIIKRSGENEDAPEVLVNPGGPGGSSVEMVRYDYERVQEKIGTQYSLIGIDPRGVGNSGPSSDCFPEYSYIARNSFLAEVFAPADITSDYALRKSHEYMRGYGNWCSSVYKVNGTARYAGTVATAQDMFHYIELRAESKGEPPAKAKLRYYGISYGTILGGTFASLYPGRIERMIIDGVMDLEDHYNGGWEKSIVDNDEAARYFFKRCFEAGPTLCLFHQNASSWEELEQRYTHIVEALLDSPIAVGDFGLAKSTVELFRIVATPTLLTWQDVVNTMFTTSYLLQPDAYIALDYVLTELQTGLTQYLNVVPVKAQISTSFPKYDERMARILVNCLDANRRLNISEFSQYKSFIEKLYKTSVYGGLNTAYQSGPICSHLEISPPESQVFDGTSPDTNKFQGPDRFEGVPRVASTSAPILLVSMLYDPVTPLPAARKMHSLFPGSGLLIGNNSGVSYLMLSKETKETSKLIAILQHCAHFQKSKCLTKYEKQYMLDGTLPPPDTTCELDQPNAFLLNAEKANHILIAS